MEALEGASPSLVMSAVALGGLALRTLVDLRSLWRRPRVPRHAEPILRAEFDREIGKLQKAEDEERVRFERVLVALGELRADIAAIAPHIHFRQQRKEGPCPPSSRDTRRPNSG